MTEKDIAMLTEAMQRRLTRTSLAFHRHLYANIEWGDRLLVVKGPRGVGKTTLLMQRIKENFRNNGRAFYVSLDNLFFAQHSLREVADWHYKNGGTHLFVDEVHYAEHWQTEIKNIYDDYPDLNLAYTGSSMLRIDRAQGDLSRRQMVYRLDGLSFREFLSFEKVADFPPLSLEQILSDHVSIATEITGKVKVLPLFRTYLKNGYYPFYKEVKAGYGIRIREVVDEVLEKDYPAIEEVSIATIRKTRKMLMILAASCPQTPNMSRLYAELETDRNQGLKMLAALEDAGLLRLLSTKSKKMKEMSRPEKIYCDNTNLMRALHPESNVGTERETFFLNQVSFLHDVTYPPKGDFLVDGRYRFEVGGEGKGFSQIADIPDSYVVNDDVEVGFGRKIPLWLFGFLY